MLEEFSTFVYCALVNFNSIGAVAPSSQALAKAITARIAQKTTPANVLEVGAGTGVFTKQLIQILGDTDTLDICEINPKFLQYLRNMVYQDPSFKNFKGTVRVLPIPVQTITNFEHYDFIVSGLPLNAFPPELVSEILEVLLKLVKPNGWISYFEYMGIRNLKSLYSGRKEKERVRKVRDVLKQFIDCHQVSCIPVWRNFPPAYTRHCQKR